jgi:hypothetical protein
MQHAPVNDPARYRLHQARMYSARTGKAYLGYRPSKKSIKRMVENVHALTCVAVAHDELFRFLLDGRPLRIREGLPLLCAGYR